MSAVVIRPDTHVLKCQAKYGFVLAEQLDNSASGAGGVKAIAAGDAVGRESAVSSGEPRCKRQLAAVKTTA